MDRDLKDRKKKHLDICLDPSSGIESGSTGLDTIRLRHAALSPVSPEKIDLTTSFLGIDMSLPLMISCMTGGSEEGSRLNHLLADCAGSAGIAIGTGSIRVLLDHPETRQDFMLKETAPNVPVLANIGAAQLSEGRHREILEAARSIGADGIFVHLNSAQEMFQPEGDRDFTGWADGIARFVEASDIPVLVKETGAGIPPADGLELLNMGVSYIDIAGSGGTDWIAVESLRMPERDRPAAESFRNWGYSTAELLLAYRQISRAGGESGRNVEGRIIASGGLRSPADYAVSLASGAHIAASALPFIRKAADGGIDSVHAYLETIEQGIRAAMALSSASTLRIFRESSLVVPEYLSIRAENLAEEALRAEEVLR